MAIYKPSTTSSKGGPAFLVNGSKLDTPPTVSINGKTYTAQYLNTIDEGSGPRSQYIFPSEITTNTDGFDIVSGGQTYHILNGSKAYEGESGSMAYRGQGRGDLTDAPDSANGATRIGYGAVPENQLKYFPTASLIDKGTGDITAANYDYTDPQKFASTYGEFNRGEVSKNFAQAQGMSLAQLDTELKGLQSYVPAASALKRSETSLDNQFNQAQRTAQVNQALPGANTALAAQAKRADAYANGRLPDSVQDRALELGVRSQAADQASTGGFGATSSVARKSSDLMSASQRLQVAQYGEGLVSSNIKESADLNLAPTEYSNAGTQVSVTPSISASQLTASNLSTLNSSTLISPTEALNSVVTQNQFKTNLEQSTRQFNAQMDWNTSQFNANTTNTFALDKFNYRVGYAGSVAGALQTDINTTTALQQQASAKTEAEKIAAQTQLSNALGAGITAVGSIASTIASMNKSGSTTSTSSDGTTTTAVGDGTYITTDKNGNTISTTTTSSDGGTLTTTDANGNTTTSPSASGIDTTNTTTASNGNGTTTVTDTSTGTVATTDSSGNSTTTSNSGTTSSSSGGTINAPTGEEQSGGTVDTTGTNEESLRVQARSLKTSKDSGTADTSSNTSATTSGSSSAATSGSSSAATSGSSSATPTVQISGQTSPQVASFMATHGVQAAEPDTTNKSVNAGGDATVVAPSSGPTVTYDSSKLDSATTAALANAGVTSTPTANSVQKGNDFQGQPIYHDRTLNATTDTQPVLDKFQKDMDTIKKAGVNVSDDFINTVKSSVTDPAFAAKLSAAVASGDSKAFVNTILDRYHQPLVKNMTEDKRIISGIDTAYTAYRMFQAWDKMSPAQKALGLTTMGIQGYRTASGTDLADTPIPNTGTTHVDATTGQTVTDREPLTVGNILNGIALGIDTQQLISNWGDMNDAQRITMSTGTFADALNLAKSMGLLNTGLTNGQAGMATLNFGSGVATTGQGASTLGTMATWAGPAIGILGAGITAYDTSQTWGQGGVKGRQAGTRQLVSYTAEGYSIAGGYGAVAGSVVGCIAFAGSTIKTGKSTDQTIRDAYRADWVDRGLITDKDTEGGAKMTLADGTTADLGIDGNGGLHNVKHPEQVAKGTDADGRQLKAYETDYTNDMDYFAGNTGVTMSRLMYGGREGHTDQMGNQLGNAFLGKVGYGADMTKDNFDTVMANARGAYAKAGIRSKEDAYIMVNQMVYQGRMTNADAIASQQTLNLMYDANGYQQAQKLASGRNMVQENAMRTGPARPATIDPKNDERVAKTQSQSTASTSTKSSGTVNTSGVKPLSLNAKVTSIAPVNTVMPTTTYKRVGQPKSTLLMTKEQVRARNQAQYQAGAY